MVPFIGHQDVQSNSVRICLFIYFLVGLGEDRSLNKKGGYTRRIARLQLNFAACMKNKKLKIKSKTCPFLTRGAKRIEVDGAIFVRLS